MAGSKTDLILGNTQTEGWGKKNMSEHPVSRPLFKSGWQ
jgi:hypothetical protein